MSQISPSSPALSFTAIRSSGPGGQNVNKVATAIELRFDIARSELAEEVQKRLLACKDRRVSSEGHVVIKAQRFRSQERNREDALARLNTLIARVTVTDKERIATRPSKAQKQKRLEDKKKAGGKKANRRPVNPDLQ